MNEADRRAAFLRVVAGRPLPVVPDGAEWPQWVQHASAERVTPLLYEIVATVPTDLQARQREHILWLERLVMSHSVRLEHHLIGIAEALSGLGIRFAVLKGAATAHLDYPDPAWREFVDIDVLIDPADRPSATAMLARHGWVQGYALPVGHEHYTHAVTLVRDAVELDLHQRIGHRVLGLLVPTHELLDRSTPFEIAGAELRALGDVDRLIHSALHAVTSRGISRRLSSVADVLLGAELRPGSAGEVLERAERWRVRSLVERAVADAYITAELDLHPAWLAAMRRPIRKRDRLVDRAYLGDGRRPLVEELAYLRRLRGWSARSRYVRGYFTVGADYAAQHGRAGFAAQARYALEKLRSKV